jgi:hypothetical protein
MRKQGNRPIKEREDGQQDSPMVKKSNSTEELAGQTDRPMVNQGIDLWKGRRQNSSRYTKEEKHSGGGSIHD